MAIEHVMVYSNSYEKMENLLGSFLRNQNSILEDIKCMQKAGYSCYYSIQTHLCCRLISENSKIKIYKIIILSFLTYGVRNVVSY